MKGGNQVIDVENGWILLAALQLVFAFLAYISRKEIVIFAFQFLTILGSLLLFFYNKSAATVNPALVQ